MGAVVLAESIENRPFVDIKPGLIMIVYMRLDLLSVCFFRQEF